MFRLKTFYHPLYKIGFWSRFSRKVCLRSSTNWSDIIFIALHFSFYFEKIDLIIINIFIDFYVLLWLQRYFQNWFSGQICFHQLEILVQHVLLTLKLSKYLYICLLHRGKYRLFVFFACITIRPKSQPLYKICILIDFSLIFFLKESVKNWWWLNLAQLDALCRFVDCNGLCWATATNSSYSYEPMCVIWENKAGLG